MTHHLYFGSDRGSWKIEVFSTTALVEFWGVGVAGDSKNGIIGIRANTIEEVAKFLDKNITKMILGSIEIQENAILPSSREMSLIYGVIIKKKIRVIDFTNKLDGLSDDHVEQIAHLVAANYVLDFTFRCEGVSSSSQIVLAEALQRGDRVQELTLSGGEYVHLYIQTVKRPLHAMILNKCPGAIHSLTSRRNQVIRMRIVVDELSEEDVADLCVVLTTRGNTIKRLTLEVEHEEVILVPLDLDALFAPLKIAVMDPECSIQYLQILVDGVPHEFKMAPLVDARGRKQRKVDIGRQGLLTTVQAAQTKYGARSALNRLPKELVEHLLGPMLLAPRQPLRE